MSKLVKQAVKKSVDRAVEESIPIEPLKQTRSLKQFSSAEYLEQYMESATADETWSDLEKRVAEMGMRVANIRQTVTTERSAIRGIYVDKAIASPVFLVALKKAGTDVEVWAEKKALEKLPYLKGSETRNTDNAKRRAGYANEELTL